MSLDGEYYDMFVQDRIDAANTRCPKCASQIYGIKDTKGRTCGRHYADGYARCA